MDLDRWQNLRRLLDRALELDAADRRAFVDAQCEGDEALAREARSILAAYESGGDLLEAPVVRLSLDPGKQPTRVGPYRISETLGEGGMGVVYLGHRDDETFEKDVALKVLRRQSGSPELQRRFTLERQILADLEHPYIARLLDGGTTDQGLPFLVIERVEGRPIDEYCRAKSLGLEQRLELVLKVCEAIQYAHRNLVVHRDLKPSNILITEQGDPKLLDFGIAKILHPETFSDVAPQTRTGILPMTPEYASPEQVQGGAVTTATDVYALGLLIYELLCDRRPYDFSGKSLQTMVDLVCRQVPVKPSVVLEQQAEADDPSAAWAKRRSRRLAGDLDAIVLRALRKDPAERYGSVAQLADDLRRFLRGRPVEARRGSLSYVLWKFVRRNRWAVGSVVAVFLVLVGFIAVVLTMQHQIVDERDRTLRERNRAEQVSGWLIELFELPAPSRSKGERVTARELLSKSTGSIDDDLLDLQLKAELLSTLGSTHVKLGLLREGVELLTRSIRLTRRVESGDSDLLRERLKLLSEALTLQGELQRAEVVARELLARLQQGARYDTPAEVSLALSRLGHLRNLLGDADAAGELLGRARVAADLAGDPVALAKALEYSGDERMGRGDPTRAVEHYSRALDLLLNEHGELHPDVVLLKSSLAAAVKGFDPDRAEGLFEEAIADQRRLFDDAHPILATALNNLGLLHLERGRHAEAEPRLTEAVAMQEKLYGARHPKYAVMLGNLANAERFLGRLDAAERRMRQAVEIFESRLGGEHGDLALTLANLAELLLERGRLEEATGLIHRADEIATKVFRGGHPHLTSILNTRGQIEWANGDLQTASATFQRAVDHADRSRGGSHSTLPAVLANLADTQRRLGRAKAAAASMERALSLIADHGELDRRRLQWLTWLAHLELDLRRFSLAEEHGRAAFEGWKQATGESDVWTLSAQKILGTALMELGRFDESEALLSSLVEALEAGGPSRAERLEAAQELLEEVGRKRSAAAS